MTGFRRRKGETAGEWAARLNRVDASTLSPRRLEDLTLCRVLAGRALRRESAARGGRDGHAAGEPPQSKDLLRCIEAARALSPDDRRRLIQWLRDDLCA
jgi:hypothetical protein